MLEHRAYRITGYSTSTIQRVLPNRLR